MSCILHILLLTDLAFTICFCQDRSVLNILFWLLFIACHQQILCMYISQLLLIRQDMLYVINNLARRSIVDYPSVAAHKSLLLLHMIRMLISVNRCNIHQYSETLQHRCLLQVRHYMHRPMLDIVPAVHCLNDCNTI